MGWEEGGMVDVRQKEQLVPFDKEVEKEGEGWLLPLTFDTSWKNSLGRICGPKVSELCPSCR